MTDQTTRTDGGTDQKNTGLPETVDAIDDQLVALQARIEALEAEGGHA